MSLPAALLQQMEEAGRRVLARTPAEDEVSEFRTVQGLRAPPGLPLRLAVLTAWRQVAGYVNMFTYAWAERKLVVAAGPVPGLAAVAGGQSGTVDSNFAISLSELTNPAARGTTSDGTRQGGAAYPQKFNLEPLGGWRGGDTLATAGACETPLGCLLLPWGTDAGPVQIIIATFAAHDGSCS